MHRLDGGRPIRQAMTDAGLSIEKLAQRTREVDPAGYGIRPATIGHMVSQGSSGRESFTQRSCDLVAHALGVPVERLFRS